MTGSRPFQLDIATAIALAVSAVAVAAFAVPVLARAAARVGFVDRPGGRKAHVGAVPLIGGLAVVLAAFAALGIADLWLPSAEQIQWTFAVAVLVLLVGGILDDAFNLPASIKAAIQVVALTPPVLLANLRIEWLGRIPHSQPLLLHGFALPYTFLCLLGFVNAFNMLDGLDGLAGGVALVCSFFLGALAYFGGDWRILFAVVAFAAGTLVFLAYNIRTPWRGRAAVFLGDAGSMVLGLVLGWAAIRLAGNPHHAVASPMAIAWVLGLPVVDTLVVMGRRLLRRRSPFAPDRMHLHHLLLDLGLAPATVTAVMLFLAGCYGAVGFLAPRYGVPDGVLLIAAFGAIAVHAAFATYAGRRIRWQRSAAMESTA